MTITTIIALALGALAPVAAHAQSPSPSQSDYPARPIRLIVPVSPGGVTDLAARTLSGPLSQSLGQQLTVENRPGAGGVIGTEAAMRAAPDGYTLLMVSAAEMTVNPALLPKIPYNPQRDFVPIVPISNTALVFAVHASQPHNTLRDFVAAAKARPGQIAFASAGNGTINHIAGEWLANLAGIQLIHVPYKGGGPATQDVVAGQVPVGMLALSAALPHVRAGKLKALGVSTARRVSFVPELATIAEQGFSEMDATVWVGFFAPAGTPAPIIARLNADVNRALRTPEIRERFNSQGADVLGGTSEEMAALVRNGQARFARLIRQYDIRPD